MTDLDKRIDEIMELDRARQSTGDWKRDSEKNVSYTTEFKENNVVCACVFPDDAAFIAKAPKMVSIIRELQAELAARDNLIEEAREKLLECKDLAKLFVWFLDNWGDAGYRNSEALKHGSPRQNAVMLAGYNMDSFIRKFEGTK